MVVVVETESLPEYFLPLCKKYSLEIVDKPPVEEDYFFWHQQQLHFHYEAHQQNFTLHRDVDFKNYKRQNMGRKKNPLLRALGLDKSDQPIIDGTLGFGKDFFMLLYFGVTVQAVDRDSVPCIMAEAEALRIGSLGLLDDLASQPQFHQQDIVEFLQQNSCQNMALYIDPIFAPSRKGALPKKDMAFLRRRSCQEFEPERVYQEAKSAGCQRLVVKRPRKGQHLIGQPQYEIVGKIIRFDVYTL